MDIHIKVLADRYFKGQCTPQEAKKVLDWLETEAGQQYLNACLEEDQFLLDNNNLFLSPVEVPSTDMFQNILSGIQDAEKQKTESAPEPGQLPAAEKEAPSIAESGNGYWYKIAAAIVLLICSALVVQHFYAPGKTIIYTTKYGETARIVLPDSSIVNLNGNSRLEYASNWSAHQAREVKLTGEAYFSVVHKRNNQKFWVTTSDNIKVEVLGTEFNVSDREQTQVVLASGKVRLDIESTGQKASSVIMKPGDAVDISANKDSLLRRKVDAAVYSSWKNDKLLFDNTSVREICRRIKDTYGYQVKVTDPALLQQRITGSVPNQSIELVLDGLELLLDVKVIKSTNVIQILPNN